MLRVSRGFREALDSGWRRSCTASGPQLHGLLGSTGQRPTPPHYSLDPVHGPGVGLGLWPQFPLPTCSRRACSVGAGFFSSRGVFCCVLPASVGLLFFALRLVTVRHLTYSFSRTKLQRRIALLEPRTLFEPRAFAHQRLTRISLHFSAGCANTCAGPPCRPTGPHQPSPSRSLPSGSTLLPGLRIAPASFVCQRGAGATPRSSTGGLPRPLW